jgi:hypothetical protein
VGEVSKFTKLNSELSIIVKVVPSHTSAGGNHGMLVTIRRHIQN